MHEGDVIAATAKIKFLQVARISQIAIQQITLSVTDFARQCRTFKPRLVTFDYVTRNSRIPVIVRGIVKTDIAQVKALLLVTTELRSQKAGLATALERRHNHRENRHRHVGNVQYHRARRNRFLWLHHHAASVKIEVLVRRIVTRTEVAASNLDSRIGQTTNFHAVQLLVVLERRRIIHLADFGLEIVLETHSRKRRILGFAEHGISASGQNLIFLVHPNRVGFQRRGAVLELCRIIQVERRCFYVIHQIDCSVFNRIHTRRVVHPIDFRRILFDLNTLFKFKAGHLLAIRARSKDRSNQKSKNGPQVTMGCG